MQWKLTLTRAALADLSAGLRANPARVRVCPAGFSRLPESTELLLHSVDSSMPATRGLPARVVVLGAAAERDLPARLCHALERPVTDPPAVFLALGTSAASGHVAGFGYPSLGVAEPLSSLTVVAEGLPRITPSTSAGLPLSLTESDIWSRTIGALGENVWRRLTELHYCIIGCGRTGSQMAASLSRFGAKRLTLIDPDRWEMHNLGECDTVGVAAVGQAKATALAGSLADSLASQREGANLSALKESALALPALIAAKESDVLICAADNATAHLATAVLAKLYLKPLLDIGTGVLTMPGGGRRMGADVRLVLPDRCLMCFGGVAGFAEARRELLEGRIARNHSTRDWQRERIGSLRSLNMIASGHALRLLEEFAAGRIRASTWLNLEFGGNGLPALTTPASEINGRCAACGFTGHGDSGITQLADMLRAA